MQNITKILYEKIKKGLQKTRNNITGRIFSIFSRGANIEENVDDIEEILIESDIGIELSMKAIEYLKGKCLTMKTPDLNSAITSCLKDFLLKHLLDVQRELKEIHPLTVIVFFGINGTGKTTSIAKIAKLLQSKKKQVMLAACDTFRPAAIEQIALWGEKLGISIVKSIYGADAASVAFDAISSAQAKSVDYLLIDTAGRLHSKKELMEELKKIIRVCQNKVSSEQIEKIFILDGTTGQNGLIQARAFHEAVGLDSIIVTKLDGTAKGGIVISIENELKVPVKFIGIGEGMDDLIPFNKDIFVDAILM